jgi:hypothetical protein
MFITKEKLKALVKEEIKKILQEREAAFHGFKMSPTQMRVSPQCDTAPSNKQWQSGEAGCPQFTHERGISLKHEDILQAIEYLDNIRPSDLIAYSRGAAVAFAALPKAQHSPKVTFVAPAWKRGWVKDLIPRYSSGVIMHGTMDEAVPLKHSFELAKITGMGLYVFPNMKHVSILKHKDGPTSGILITPERLELGLRVLPEWEGASTPDKVEDQHNIAMSKILTGSIEGSVNH